MMYAGQSTTVAQLVALLSRLDGDMPIHLVRWEVQLRTDMREVWGPHRTCMPVDRRVDVKMEFTGRFDPSPLMDTPELPGSPALPVGSPKSLPGAAKVLGEIVEDDHD